MSEKNQLSAEIGHAAHPNVHVQQPQNYGFTQPTNTQNYGFQPPPSYDQSFPQAAQPQQQQQFYPHQAATQIVTVVTTTSFGSEPRTITCPSCHHGITTRVDYESSSKTHLMAVLLCLLVWPCFWIPYAVDSCKNANHYCPACNAYLGSYTG